MGSSWKSQIEALLAGEDYEAVVRLARANAQKVLRYLSGRLCSADEDEKWRAVRAFERVAGDREIVSHERAIELLRRFFWALNDESGAVPYGVPEAIGAILAVRPELQPEYLPILRSMIHEEGMLQTGPIEQGVRWALGRIGVGLGIRG
jgi:methylated-DNA-[protein]-cysteine S-methyltransferase